MITKDGAKMSKNKGNVVPPDDLIAKYGADTERVYTLFIGPPEKDAEWNDRAVDGAFKFLNRVWRLVGENHAAVLEYQAAPAAVQEIECEPAERALRRKTHQCVQKMRRDLAVDLHFNTAISALMELVNDCSSFLREADVGGRAPARLVLGEALYHLVLMLAPMAPHLCEELWEELGHSGGIMASRFPQPDLAALAQETVTLVVQVNGKVRARLEVPAGSTETDVERLALGHPQVSASLGGRPPRKVVVIPDKLVNVVG